MSFDRLAAHYGWMEAVVAGPRLQRSRVAWIDRLADRRRLLIAGVGHGRFLRAFLARRPSARVTCLDASRGMLHEARERARRAGCDLARVEFVHARLPEWSPPAEPFDAIVTNFFLDCFPPAELAATVACLASAAAPDARWLLADFAVPKRGPPRWRAQAVHALMYAFFRATTGIQARALTEPDPLLAAHGFVLRGRKSAEGGLLRADWWERVSR
ncbi:MAG: class I SAM-dependent methyltransferase [Opitutaceae bacterium]|nr:class I SAM-dependent methyltransferase [Opitutaceae bacterium]